ncbi:MAG: GNAT family N-acetyltransferase [Clostridia bacterium]|nr:GNAT family N-acetyltransferase [Clostridia bacterium]
MILVGKQILLFPLTLEELKFPDSIDADLTGFEWSEVSKRAISMKIEKMKNLDESIHPLYTYWMMVEKSTGEGVGLIGFKGMFQGAMEVGYGVSKRKERLGYASEALKLLVNWAFEYTFCHKITAYGVLKDNRGSIKVLEKNGFECIESKDTLKFELKNSQFVFKSHLKENTVKRPGAYLILKAHNRYGVVQVRDTHFLIGGGLEEKDDDLLQCIHREALEEIGYTIKNLQYLTTMEQYEVNKEKNHYLHLIGHVFLGELDQMIEDPIEVDHTLVWITPDHLENKLWVDYQRYVIEKLERGDLYGVS